MKKNTIIITALFASMIGVAQQIGDGYAPGLNNYTIPLKSGVYSGLDATGGIPDTSNNWNHLFIIRHANENNNHQLQIASAYSENDRLFFRKIASDLTPSNPIWMELATRGINTFTGNQIVNGNVGIGTALPNGLLDIQKTTLNAGGQSVVNIVGSTWAGDGASLVLNQLWNDRYYKTIIDNFGGNNAQTGSGLRIQTSFWDGSKVYTTTPFVLTPTGDLGIGTSNPDSKLAVNGTIHSKEVKVDMTGWPDYVFKKGYDLPTLEEVEKQINEKGHLENIPSEKEVVENGLNLGEMNAKLLQKIEELTLYNIQQSKEIQVLKKENKSVSERLAKIEQLLK